MSGVVTYYVGNYYEVSGSTTTKYYYFGSQRVAMSVNGAVSYLHGDHLGSTSVTSGANSSTQTYYPFGSVRTTSGSVPTDYGFTGQKSDASDALMFYGARYYDPLLGRFTQADTIVPDVGNPQSLNRYSYVVNNPLKYTDPSGHDLCDHPTDACDTYYNAQGLCWSDTANGGEGGYKRHCDPIVKTAEDLEQLSIKHPDFLTNPNLRLLFNDPDQGRRLRVLDNVGVYMVGAGSTELNVLVTLTRLDAMMVGNDPAAFVDDLSLLFLGWHPWEAIRCAVEQLCYKSYKSAISLRLINGGTGFDPSYQDPPWAVAARLGTQVFHLWEFVDLGFQYNAFVSVFGDEVHEYTEWLSHGAGASIQDLNLAAIGAGVGQRLQDGSLTPLDVSPVLDRILARPWPIPFY